MRQGNDWGTQYRSVAFYFTENERILIENSKIEYSKKLNKKISTEIKNANVDSMNNEIYEFFYAEDYHQQYLSKHPHGYCNLKGTGVSCPTIKPQL